MPTSDHLIVAIDKNLKSNLLCHILNACKSEELDVQDFYTSTFERNMYLILDTIHHNAQRGGITPNINFLTVGEHPQYGNLDELRKRGYNFSRISDEGVSLFLTGLYRKALGDKIDVTCALPTMGTVDIEKHFDFNKVHRGFLLNVLPAFLDEGQFILDGHVGINFMKGLKCNCHQNNRVIGLLLKETEYMSFVNDCICMGNLISQYEKRVILDSISLAETITVGDHTIFLCNNPAVLPKDVDATVADYLMVYEITPKKDCRELFINHVDPVTMKSNKGEDVKELVLKNSIFNFTVYPLNDKYNSILLTADWGGKGTDKVSIFSFDIYEIADALDFLLPFDISDFMDFHLHRAPYGSVFPVPANIEHRGIRNTIFENPVDKILYFNSVVIQEYLNNVRYTLVDKKGFELDYQFIVNDLVNFIGHTMETDVITFTISSKIIEKVLTEIPLVWLPDYKRIKLSKYGCALVEGPYHENIDHPFHLEKLIHAEELDFLIYYRSESFVNKHIKLNDSYKDDPRINIILQNWMDMHEDSISFSIVVVNPSNDIVIQEFLPGQTFTSKIKCKKSDKDKSSVICDSIKDGVVHLTILLSLDDIGSVLETHFTPSARKDKKVSSVEFKWSIDFIDKMLGVIRTVYTNDMVLIDKFDSVLGEMLADTGNNRVTIKYTKNITDKKERRKIKESLLNGLGSLLNDPNTTIGTF